MIWFINIIMKEILKKSIINLNRYKIIDLLG